ncbi:hypothetical protein N665_0593s0017 [Sinapis alba]|nr:hypothetical protein N665_0593s0017 [Sinapis alba]
MSLSWLIDRKVGLGFAKVSGNYVGAVGVGSSGIAYLGINVELPRLPPHYSIHAEQFLVTNLSLNDEPDLTYLAISADDTNFVAPCLQCYYFLQEIHEPPNILIKTATKTLTEEKTNRSKTEYVNFSSLVLEFSQGVTFNSLPPHPFPELAHLLEVRDNKLTLVHAEGKDPDDGMKRTALAAANRSFSPYTKSPSGVALKDGDQNVYRGWYMESATNVKSSLGPVQAALVHFVTEGGTKFENIVEAVLVEKKDADVSHEATAKMILDKIAPDCAFTVFHCFEP